MTHEPVKAFLVYVGDNYYPGEAVVDLKASADTLEEARVARDENYGGEYQWWAIVDHRTMTVIESAGC